MQIHIQYKWQKGGQLLLVCRVCDSMGTCRYVCVCIREPYLAFLHYLYLTVNNIQSFASHASVLGTSAVREEAIWCGMEKSLLLPKRLEIIFNSLWFSQMASTHTHTENCPIILFFHFKT